MKNINKWMECYRDNLIRQRAKHPHRYHWPDEMLDDVCERMRAGFLKGPGHFNKDSFVIRAVCDHFGIPYTYTAIARFISGNVVS